MLASVVAREREIGSPSAVRHDSDDHPRRNPRRFYSVGFEFAGTILMLLAGGYLLDRWLHTTPAFMVWGGIVGFYVAMRRLLKQAQEARKSLGPDDDSEAGQDPR